MRNLISLILFSLISVAATSEITNVAVGESVLINNTTGKRNTGIGYNALLKNTSGKRVWHAGHGLLKRIEESRETNYNIKL